MSPALQDPLVSVLAAHTHGHFLWPQLSVSSSQCSKHLTLASCLCASFSHLHANRPLNPAPAPVAPTGLFTAPSLAHGTFLPDASSLVDLLPLLQAGEPLCFVILLALTWLAHTLLTPACTSGLSVAACGYVPVLTIIPLTSQSPPPSEPHCCSAVIVRFPSSRRPPFS